MAQRSILIFEPEADGHQMELLRFLLDAIRQHLPGLEVLLLTTGQAEAHPNTRRLVADFQDILRVVVAPPVGGRHPIMRHFGAYAERQWQAATQFSRGLAAIGPDRVGFILVPHLECMGLLSLALRPGLFAGLPWAAIAIALRFHHRQAGVKGPVRAQDFVYRILFFCLLARRNLVCLGSVNPYLASTIQHPKIVWCPEPAAAVPLADPAIARAAYGLRPESVIVLVFGFIDRRKSVDLLLEAVTRLDPALDVTVFIAGTQHAGHMRPILESPVAQALRAKGRLVECNRFIMVGPDIDPMSVADIVWVFYEKNFVLTGNVLARAAVARRAVICRNHGVMGRLVEQSGCGIILDSDEPTEIAAALTQLATDPALRDAMGEKGAAAFAGNTPQAFARPIIAAIARHYGVALA